MLKRSRNGPATRPRVVEVVYSFETGGSERLGARIARDLSTQGIPAAVCATHTDEGPVSRELEDLGIPCFALGCEDRTRVGRRIAVARLFSRLRPDVLHMHHVNMLMLCHMPARVTGARRIVLTEHTDMEIRRKRRIYRAAKRLCRKVDAITVVHSQLYRYFTNTLAAPTERLSLIRNGIDTESYAPAPTDQRFCRSLGLDGSELVLGCVGRLDKDKGQDDLVKAVELIRARAGLAIVLLLVGDGPLRGSLEQLAHRSGVGSNVIFLGERHDIPRVLQNIDVFVLPSRTEGQPLALMEAMSCGLPCIATAVGGVPELLAEDTGILIPPNDPERLAEAVSRLCDSESTRTSLGQRARRRILADFDDKTMLKGYREVLLPGLFGTNASSRAVRRSDHSPAISE